MTNDNLHNQTKKKRFDSFMDQTPVRPWNQTLCIMKETLTIEQSNTGSAWVSYTGNVPEMLALMVALCGIYHGHKEGDADRWYFHAQLQPCLQIALLALQDKAPSQLVEDILSARR